MKRPRHPSPPFNGDGIGRLIDTNIATEVRVLWESGIETFESCEGGVGHSFHEPTVRFHGDRSEGLRALSIALQHGLKVAALRRYWSVENGEPVGPYWELTFHGKPSSDAHVEQFSRARRNRVRKHPGQ
jgi:hypothetical protein